MDGPWALKRSRWASCCIGPGRVPGSSSGGGSGSLRRRRYVVVVVLIARSSSWSPACGA
jgi:hypothetical protein